MSTPSPVVFWPSGTPSGSLWMRIPLSRIVGLRGSQSVMINSMLTVLLGVCESCYKFSVSVSPSCVHAPSKLMMFLCRPIIFIISISDTRSERSFSVASSRKDSGNIGCCWGFFWWFFYCALKSWVKLQYYNSISGPV